METQTQMHRTGLNPFLTFSIDTMLNLTVTLTQTQTSSVNTALLKVRLHQATPLCWRAKWVYDTFCRHSDRQVTRQRYGDGNGVVRCERTFPLPDTGSDIDPGTDIRPKMSVL